MIKNWIVTLALFTVLLLFWEYASRSSKQLQFILPAPSQIAKVLVEHPERLLLHSWATFKEIAGGFILALIVAFPLAWGMYLWNTLGSFLQPLFVLIQCIPMFTLAPIMVFWFDWSYTAIVVPTALMIFFPLTISIYQGLKSVPQSHIDYFKVHQATAWQMFSKLLLPWAFPTLLAGLRISAAIAGIGAVAAEWAGAQTGLGILMLESRRATDLEMAFAALFCLTAMSMALYGCSILIEKRSWISKSKRSLLTALVPCCLLVGCDSNSPSAHKTTHLILDWLPNPNHVPLYVGIEQGIFHKYGIDLTIAKINDPGDTVSYISSGKVDLALYYMPETYLANSQGAGLATIGVLFKQPLNAFIFRKDTDLKSPQDIQGKKLGYVVGGFGLFFLNNMLQEVHVQPEELFNVNFDLVSTLGAKRVDVIYGAYWNIETEHLRSLGIETDYLPLSRFNHPNYYELIVVAKEETPFSTPEYIQKFKAALQESIDFAKENPEKAFEMYQRANPDKREKTLAWEKQAWQKTAPLLAPDQENDPLVWEQFDKWIKEHNFS